MSKIFCVEKLKWELTTLKNWFLKNLENGIYTPFISTFIIYFKLSFIKNSFPYFSSRDRQYSNHIFNSTMVYFWIQYVVCESLKWSSSDSWSHFNTGSEPMLYILYNVSVCLYTIIVPTSIKYTLSDVLIVDSK